MAKQTKKDDTEILLSIIAKSTNKNAVAAAQSELGALQERKSSLAAAIQPALDVPQIIAKPTSRGVAQSDENVAKNIKALKDDMSLVLAETKKSRTLLEGILKTNQKYFESNSELIDRLLMATNLSQEQLDALRKKTEAQAKANEASGVLEPQPTNKEQTGGGGLLSVIGGGLAGLLGGSMFRKKPAPDADVDPKKKKTTDGPDDPDKKNKPKGDAPEKAPKGKGGRIGKILGFLAATGALYGGIEAFDFLTDEDANWSDLIPDMLKDYIPENVVQAAPDAALATALQAPTIMQALKSEPKPVVDVPDTKTPTSPPPAKPAPKTTPPAEPPVKPTPKAPPKGSSPAQEIWNNKIRGAGKATQKEIIEATAEKVGKSTVKSVIKKIPIVGLLAGLGLGGYRYLWEGDSVGAGLEVGAGAAAMIPGVGTVGSVGIDVASLVRDIYASVYGTFPEEDALASERFDELNATIMKYLSEMYGSPSPEPQSSIEMPQGAADDFAAAIAATTSAQTSVDASVNPNKSRAEYLSNAGSMPTPVQKMTPNKLNTIGNPAGVGPANIVINKQGDTITKVINGNAGGGGSSGVAGSPSRVPSPFDYLLYGDTYNWGY